MAAIVLILAWPVGVARAGEATAKGRAADITWVDEQGAEHVDDARDIRYVHVRRLTLRVPDGEGRTYRDEEIRDTGLTAGGRFHKWAVLDRIDLEWVRADAEAPARLVARLTLLNGDGLETTGNALPGAHHPTSPWISWTVEGQERRVALLPVSSEEERRGKPRLVRIDFKLAGRGGKRGKR